jgi:uncharacterized OB-fold protein
MSNQPLPTPSPWSAPFWDAINERTLVIQRCVDCDVFIMYPKRLCPSCLGENMEWVPSEGAGEVYTYTHQVAGPPSGFEDQVPYTIAVVKLDEGVQLMANLIGVKDGDVDCGSRVELTFIESQDGGRLLPAFRLTAKV